MFSLVFMKHRLRKCLNCVRYLSSNNIETQLIDYLELSAHGGMGGNGCASHVNLLRDKIKRDGGKGGKGGNVLLKSSAKTQDFNQIESIIYGANGGHGEGKNKRGTNGNDRVISVPLGTIVGSLTNQAPIVVLSEEEQVYMAAEGGQGGMGNSGIFYSRRERSGSYKCWETEMGYQGSVNELYLEMKIIADIGLVGLPNAGKSSLLRAISAAKPKVASYPFTTLRPHIGVIHYDGFYRVKIADIPGLLKGSSLGYGIGISFLKHIERCKSLLYVVDMCGVDYSPHETIHILQKELEDYKAGMSNNIVGIVANKVDLLQNSTDILILAKEFPQYPVIPISALNQKNIIAVRNVLEKFKTLHLL